MQHWNDGCSWLTVDDFAPYIYTPGGFDGLLTEIENFMQGTMQLVRKINPTPMNPGYIIQVDHLRAALALQPQRLGPMMSGTKKGVAIGILVLGWTSATLWMACVLGAAGACIIAAMAGFMAMWLETLAIILWGLAWNSN